MNYWEGKNFIKKHNAVGEDDKIGLQKNRCYHILYRSDTVNRA